jgi:2-furoyl-CoA dehydrogenase 2Fe-2S iron sulfur subunit
MSVEAFLEGNTDPKEEEIRDMLSGHLCRCTGYVGMVRAITEVAARRKEAPVPSV